MWRFQSGLVAAVLLCACASLPVEAATAGSPMCAATARRATDDPRIRAAIDEARRQHHLFGGQLIERNGGLVHVGFHEAEWDRLPRDTTAAWQRVAAFWQALSQEQPPRVMTSRGWVDRSEAASAVASQGAEPAATETAVREALLRAAIVDTPWSAAFISYLMKEAGFSGNEFVFSDTHADYVRAALEASAAEAAGRDAPHAFRACDVAKTPPRAGDLLCATRAGSGGITTFGALAAAMASQPDSQAFAMHCDLVVRSDEGGDAKIETIGGNVVQSVTLTRMTLDANKVLSHRYIGSPPSSNLSRRPWVVLLQFRH
jgi:hypothetical protein